MKRFYFLSLCLVMLSNLAISQDEKPAEMRFINTTGLDCESTPNVCYDVQMRALDESFLLQGVNMRMFFDLAQMEYVSADCAVLQQSEGKVYQCNTPSVFEPAENPLGFVMPRYISWNLNGTSFDFLSAEINAEWKTVQTICFNLTQAVEGEFCANLVWELQEDGDGGWQDGSDGVVINELAIIEGQTVSLPVDESVQQYNWIYTNNTAGSPDANPTNCIDGDCEDPFSVDLISFDVKKKDEKSSLLTWTTANEVNNSHFEVQRSTNGFNFEKIGEVPASEKQNALNRYDFVDHNPTKGRNYYRLKQVDLDGVFELTYIRTVDFFSGKLSVATFPNPVSEFLYVDLGLEDLNATRDFDVTLSDLTGKVLENKKVNVDASTRVKIDMDKYAPGTYIIRVVSGDLEQTEKIIKVN